MTLKATSSAEGRDPGASELDAKFDASVKAIGAGIDRLQASNAELAEALGLAEEQMTAARLEINRLRKVAKLPEMEPAALNVAVYKAKTALAKALGHD